MRKMLRKSLNIGVAGYFFVSLLFLLLSGCASFGQQKGSLQKTDGKLRKETKEEILSAAGTVVEAVSGQDMTEEELKDFVENMRKDEEAQEAVETIADALDQNHKKVKYCPVTGKRYRYSLERCPIHNVPLKVLGEE